MRYQNLRNSEISVEQNDKEQNELQNKLFEFADEVKFFIKCSDCGENCHIISLYRCYYCGFYFCHECVEKHFDHKEKKEGN